eukprot:11163064-Lingulodinium_polyedra.AAC.1
MRTGLELVALREAIAQVEFPVKWVHSDAMLANSLTKGHEKWQLELLFRNGCRWRVAYDEKFESAKRRKKKGF